jgi:hypothetical protein
VILGGPSFSGLGGRPKRSAQHELICALLLASIAINLQTSAAMIAGASHNGAETWLETTPYSDLFRATWQRSSALSRNVCCA